MREGARTKHSFAMLPFGYGPRSCLGQRFAEMEMHVFLAKVSSSLSFYENLFCVKSFYETSFACTKSKLLFWTQIYTYLLILQVIQQLKIKLKYPEKDHEVIYKPFPDTTEPIAFQFQTRE